MATNRIKKNALVAATITFTQLDDVVDALIPSMQNVSIDIITLDAVGGVVDPATAGTFTVWYKTDVNGGWKTPSTNPIIEFGEAAGSSGADGAALGASFVDLALEIKVVPAGILGAAAYRVLIKQFN